MSPRYLASAILTLAVLCPRLTAAVQCPAVFGSHMVLQRDRVVPVWGTADAGEKVQVEFAGQQAATTANANGTWQVTLSPLTASTEPRVLVVRGTNELRFEDVLVGEVCLCSGQSNMEKQLGLRGGQQPTDNHEEEIRNANHPLLRLFQMARNNRPQPGDLTQQWQICSPEVIDRMKFSAAGYFFGREILAKLSVPVGLIHTSVGGTRIEPWTPPTAFDDIPSLRDYAKAAAGDRKIDGTTIANLYTSMVDPLAPYAIRGFLWYQGESNLIAGETTRYTDKMRALVGGWRKRWNLPDAPFYFVQIAPHTYSSRKASHLTREALPLFWEAQTRALSIPHTGMIVITDTVKRYSDIHPTDKRTVGERLARLALKRDYGRNELVDSGPVLKSAAVRNGTIEIEFDHADGLASRDGKPLSEFTIAGADRVFVPAEAVIRDGRVVVSSASVSQPVAVRLGWNEHANPNLVNSTGLPARVFRTDNWPVEVFLPTQSEGTATTGTEARK